MEEREGVMGNQIVVSGDGKLLATTGLDHVKLWKVEGHQLMEEITGIIRNAYVDIALDGDHIATSTWPESSDRAQLRIWRVGER